MQKKISINVLYIISGLQLGGCEKHLVQLLPELIKEGVKPVVCSLSGKGPLSGQLEEAGIPILYPSYSGLIHSFPKLLKWPLTGFVSTFVLIKYMLIHKPKIVHMFLPSAYIFGGLCSIILKIPIKIMSRRSRNHYQDKYPFIGAIEKFLHKRMDLLLGNSKIVSSDLIQESKDAEKIRTIYNGVQIKKPVAKNTKSSVRNSLDISEDIVVFVITANLIYYKGHDFLIESLSMIKDLLRENWLLLVIGEDRGNLSRLKFKAKSLGVDKNIRWLGLQNDVRYFLSASDVGILCSHEEGFANALLEYMEASLPTVVTDVGGNKEAVVHGVTGLVVSPGDCGELSSAILYLKESASRRRNMGAAARKRVSSLFSHRASASDYMRCYHEAIKYCAGPN